MNFETTRPIAAIVPAAVNNLAANREISRQFRESPLFLRQQHDETFRKCMALFEKSAEELKPTTAANLDPDKVLSSETAMLIDNLFKTAIRNYRTELLKAGVEDLALAQLHQQIPNLTTRAVIINTARYLAKAPNIPVIKQISIPILAFFGALTGLFKKKSVGREITQISTSANRHQWMNEVSVLEKDRIAKSLSLISQRAQTIKMEIQEGDLLDIGLFEELELLNSLHDFFNQGAPLKIDDQLISEFLQNIQREIQ